MNLDSLSAMPKWKQVLFIARMAERFWPNFALFSEQCQWGDATFLREALDCVWSTLREADSHANAAEVRRLCEKEMPDTEDFSSVLTSPALDAVGLICLCYDGLSKTHVPYEEAAQLSIESIDLYLQLLSKDEEEIDTSAHPMMLQELADQELSIEILNKDDRHEMVSRLLELGTARGAFPH